MMYRFSSYVLALLLLVASGQVMAANTAYFSGTTALTDADIYTGGAAKVSTNWKTGSCSGTAVSAVVAMDATDTLTICSGHTLTMSNSITLPLTGASAITLAPAAGSTAAGTLVATSTDKLTLGSGGGVVNNGIITFTANADNLAITLSGAGTYQGTTGVLNSTCTAAAAVAWTAATAWGSAATDRCGVTVGTGTAPLPSAGSAVVIGAFAVTAGTGTVKSLTLNGSTAGGLTLGGA